MVENIEKYFYNPIMLNVLESDNFQYFLEKPPKLNPKHLSNDFRAKNYLHSTKFSLSYS